jgi:hypothetical protein
MTFLLGVLERVSNVFKRDSLNVAKCESSRKGASYTRILHTDTQSFELVLFRTKLKKTVLRICLLPEVLVQQPVNTETFVANQFCRSAIFNRCAVVHWCDAKGPQICRGSLGESRQEARKIEE